jgi:hypothetical protein
LLEIYNKSFEDILYTYDDLHLRTLPLSVEERRKLSDDIMWVYLELANGYKSIVKAVYDEEKSSPPLQDIVLSIYRAIELISNALLYAFRDHQVPPPLVYLEIHQLYYLAEQYQVVNKVIPGQGNKSYKATILNLYKQIMLLIAGDAFGYGGSQVNELYLLLEKYVEACQLTTAIQVDGKNASFFIDFTEDIGPRNDLTIEVRSPSQRLLNVDQVVEMIIKDLSKQKSVPLDSLEAIELRLLRLFLRNLRYGTINRKIREPSSGIVRIAYGLDAAGYYLDHRDKFLEEKKEVVNGIEVRDIEYFEAEHELSNWNLVNINQRGRMLETKQIDNICYSVGEVISSLEFITGTQQHLISTGLIRWIRYIDNKAQMGVEYLEGEPVLVNCYAELEDSDEPMSFTGLYFPSNKKYKKPASLLFEYNYFSSAQSFLVDVAGQRYRIEPVKIFRESMIHVQFNFRVVK